MRIALVFLVWIAASYQAMAEVVQEKPGDETVATELRPEIRTTPNGVAYGLYRRESKQQAPTVIVLCSCTMYDALNDRFAGQCGRQLLDDGYVCVSIDIPCHGAERRVNEPEGLSGWSARAAVNDNYVADHNRRLSDVLDDLIETDISDPERVAVCGTSRGGFLALHFAAHENRVRCTAAFAPVTDLLALREFQGQTDNPLVRSLALVNAAARLAGKPVWLVIGDQDERVGTDHVIRLARQLTATSRNQGYPSRVELRVVSEDRGHTLPGEVSASGAEWIRRQMR